MKELDKLEVTFDGQEFPFKVYYAIETSIIKNLISGSVKRDKKHKLYSLFQSEALFGSYRISDIVLFSDKDSLIINPDEEGSNVRYFNPCLENVLEKLGYDAHEDAALDNSDYFIADHIFPVFDLADLYELLNSDTVSGILIGLRGK